MRFRRYVARGGFPLAASQDERVTGWTAAVLAP